MYIYREREREREREGEREGERERETEKDVGCRVWHARAPLLVRLYRRVLGLAGGVWG